MEQQQYGGSSIQLIAPASLALDADFPPLSLALFEVLLRRRSCRDIDSTALNLYLLSRLLWAAFGINRPAQSRRTAPSAQDAQEIDIYLAMESGLYRYDGHSCTLCFLSGEDLRGATGPEAYVAAAPVDLIYVARLDPTREASRLEQRFYAALATGHISQNVYLFCAAEGLAAVAHSQFDNHELGQRMRLAPGQDVILAQSVGYPMGGLNGSSQQQTKGEHDAPG